MLGESGNSYSAQCLAYRQIAAQCDLKVQQTKENQKKFLSLEAQIETYSGLVDSMEQVLQKIKPWMVDLLEYNAQKKKDALVAINTALSVANYIVPSSMSGIKFRVEGKEAWLENSAGVDVDRVEGSGYKGVVSVYLRDVIVRSNPSILRRCSSRCCSTALGMKWHRMTRSPRCWKNRCSPAYVGKPPSAVWRNLGWIPLLRSAPAGC